MRKYKLIIFDLDGTLVDAYEAIEESFNYTMQELGYSRQDALTIRRAVGWGDDNLLKPFIKTKELKKALSIYRKHHKESLLRKSRVFPGVKNMLKYFKNKGIKLAIATNRPTKFTHILLRKLNIEEFFDCVLCADKLKTIKPHPEIILRIMQKLKAAKKQALYVGDMAIDVQAGRCAGIDTVAVLSGSHAKKDLLKERPTKILTSVLRLKSFIKKTA